MFDGQPHNYVIHDAMSAGLTFDIDSVVVTRYRATDAEHTGPDISLDTLAKGPDYTVKKTDTCAASAEITGCTFEIKFEDSALKANDIITVQYNATVNANAVIGVEGNPNKTILEYNNKYTAPSTTKTYVWEMGVRKFANLGESNKTTLWKMLSSSCIRALTQTRSTRPSLPPPPWMVLPSTS